MPKKNFYPPYTTIGKDKIFPSADIPLDTRQGGYFAEENCRLQFYRSSIYITDLSKAMKSGKDCEKKIFYTSNQRFGNLDEIGVTFRNQGIETYSDVLKAKNLPEFQSEVKSEKGVRVFSPFLEVKPIQVPTKWTTSHLAKAILSGQIYHGDFSDVTSTGFETMGIDLPEMARKMIEEPTKHLWFEVAKQEDGEIQVSLRNYQHESYDFMFDEGCNLEMKEEKLEEIREMLESHGMNMT